jgi:hypothetical protein
VNPRRDIVLLVTHAGDHFTVDRVAEGVARRGARPFRFDTDRFPVEVKLSFALSSEGPRFRLVQQGTTLASDDIAAVWLRRIRPPTLPEDLDARFRESSLRQAHVLLGGFLGGLATARWVDPRGVVHRAEDKLLQMRLAARHGLRVPRTLATCDPEEVRAFFAELQGSMVTKLLAPLSQSMGRAPEFMYTTAVSEADLEELDSLRFAPMLFQERIAKALELRVIFVGGRLFVGKIDARTSLKGQVDWRLADPSESPWSPGDIPADVASSLTAVMAELGLAYGAIDLIRTPEGEHVFLEVNPSGEWGMLELHLGHPIGDAIAAVLLNKGAS